MSAPEPGPGGARIHVRVRLFARLRELAGARVIDLAVPAGATVEDAWTALAAATPAISRLRAYVRFAVDGAYAEASTVLTDGSELACIPPVSGGSGEDAAADAAAGAGGPGGPGGPGGAGGPGHPRRILEVTETPFGPSILADLSVRVATDKDGAIVGFLGRTRVTPGTPAPGEEAEAERHAGRNVDALEYEAFEPLALRVLAEIADEVEARFGVAGLAIVHRIGRVPLGEPSIAIVAAAPHRAAAFAAASYAIDETKARVPIWKAEMFADGHVWVGARADGTGTGPGRRGRRTPESLTAAAVPRDETRPSAAR